MRTSGDALRVRSAAVTDHLWRVDQLPCTQLIPSSAERGRREHRHPKASTPEEAPAFDPLENTIGGRWRTRACEEMLSIAQSELADRFHQCTPAVAPPLAPPM
jgi:hypothetical protein